MDKELKELLQTIGIYFSYLIVGCLGVGFAFYLATGLLQEGEGQTPPPPPSGSEATSGGLGDVGENGQGTMLQQAEAQRRNFMAEVESYLEPFIYDPKGRRDPFTPYSEPVVQSEGGFEGPLLPLQRFDLDELVLMGIMWNIKEPKAMFKDPNGEVHVVGIEERVGRKNGYIAVIREGEVVIVEASRRKGDIIYTSRVLRIEE